MLPPEDPWIDTLAWLMDNSIPLGQRFSIGLDGLLGLVPGVGDAIGALVGFVIVWRAALAGLPRIALTRMVLNILIDTLLGSVPFVGDVFDFAFKSNTRNLQIYREARLGQRQYGRDWAFVIIALLVLGLALAVPVLVLFRLVHWMASARF